MRDDDVQVGIVETLPEPGYDCFPIFVVDVPVIEIDETHPDVAVGTLGRVPIGDDSDDSIHIGDLLHLDVVPLVRRRDELRGLRPVDEILGTGPGPLESVLMGSREYVVLPVHEEILDIGRGAHEVDRHRVVEFVDTLECLRDPDENLVALVMSVRIDDAHPPVRKQDHDAVVVVVPPGTLLEVHLLEAPAGHIVFGDSGISPG